MEIKKKYEKKRVNESSCLSINFLVKKILNKKTLNTFRNHSNVKQANSVAQIKNEMYSHLIYVHQEFDQFPITFFSFLNH